MPCYTIFFTVPNSILLYFGLTGIFWDEVYIVPGINQHYLPRDDQMMQLINQDLSCLDRIFGSAKKSFIPSSITFTCVISSDVFVFEHVSHVACSSVMLKELDHVVTRKSPVVVAVTQEVPHSCEFCYSFPYVYDNVNLAHRIEFKDHRMFKEHRDLPRCPTNSPFYVPFEFFGTGHQYSENIWSRKLTNSLNEFYFMKGFQYSAEEALQFDDHQYQYTGVRGRLDPPFLWTPGSKRSRTFGPPVQPLSSGWTPFGPPSTFSSKCLDSLPPV